MESELPSKSKNDIVIGFIIPDGKSEVTVSQPLSLAFEKSKEAGLSAIWIKEKDILDIKPTQDDVIVIDPFSGPAFNHLRQFKCSVLGPSVLLSCLATSSPVPTLPYPVYSIAMRGLLVTCTGVDMEKKKKIRKLVERMGGIYSNALHDGITHLIAATTLSQKYEIAVEKEIPCMLPTWVYDVWQVSSTELVTAVDPRFSNRICPPLHGVTVTVSQFGRADKEILQKTVESAGGSYSGVLDMETTSVLICTSNEGEKYLHAKKWNIPCVSSQWVFDSIERGVCLPTSGYRVDKKSLGSNDSNLKQRDDKLESSLLNTSNVRKFNRLELVKNSVVNETLNGSIMNDDVAGGKTNADCMLELQLCKVKSAGSFLDGCRIYLSGFSETEQLQLSRVLKYSGGVRLSQLVESVTHCVHSFTNNTVAVDTSKKLEELDLSPHMVSLQWIVESFNLGRPASEAEYLFPTPLASESETIKVTSEDISDQIIPPQIEEEASQFEASLLAQYGM